MNNEPDIRDYLDPKVTFDPNDYEGSSYEEIQVEWKRDKERMWWSFGKTAKRRKITQEEFDKMLLSFYTLTLDAKVFGYLGRPDGTYWISSDVAMDYFFELYGQPKPVYFRRSWMRVHFMTCGTYS